MNDSQDSNRRQLLLAAREREFAEAAAEQDGIRKAATEAKRYGSPDTIDLWRTLTMNGYEQAALGLCYDLLRRINRKGGDPEYWWSMEEFYRENLQEMLGGVPEANIQSIVDKYGGSPDSVRREIMRTIQSLRKPEDLGEFGF